MSEENIELNGAEDSAAAVESAVEFAEEEAEDDSGTEIRDTDIVFDCPHCGHNLAIDYRGAGLPINCVNCGESVLVPIPDGMKIDDLDLEPGEILKQLFATRRNLHKAELRAADLQSRLDEEIARGEEFAARFAQMGVRANEILGICAQQNALHRKLEDLVGGLTAKDGGEQSAQ